MLVVIVFSIEVSSQLLWKISGNGLSKASYLFGTHHVAPASILDSIKGLETALSSCEVIYGEVKKSEMTDVDMQHKTMLRAMAPSDSTLDKVLSDEEYAFVDSVVRRYANGTVELRSMSMMKPAMVNTYITIMQACAVFPDYDPDQQIDLLLQTRAEKMGLASEGFESVDFQLQLLFGDPISKQADDLLDALHRDDRMAEYARRLAYAYMSQDIDEMWRLFADEEMGSDDVEMYKMIYSRNVVWVDKLQHIMPHKSVFVCVGAGHLVGGRGVPALLRNAGYVVMPVY